MMFLIPHLKKVFDLNDFQSALIQVAFFGGYCLSALPAGRAAGKDRLQKWNRRWFGYMRGGRALLFISRGLNSGVMNCFFLLHLSMACGQGVLEVCR